jgi:hypothetical protein
MSGNHLPAGQDRVEELEMTDGEVVIYDTDNRQAWIQSDETVRPDEMV